MNPTNKAIRQAFLTEYNGHNNIMTPDIYSYGYSLKNPSLFFEVSYGTGLANDHLVGVTVLEMPRRAKMYNLNKCFSGNNKDNLLSLAREYAESLS